LAPSDRAGRVPGSLDALDLLVHLARGRAERVNADLAVRHTGAQRAYLGCGVVLRHAEAERRVLQLGDIRLDLGGRIAPARLVLVDGGAQRSKADLGIGEARAHMRKLLGGCAKDLAQLGGLRLDLSELCRQGSDAVLERHSTFAREGGADPHNIMPALTASARPIATRNRAAVPRCGKASGVIPGLRIHRSSVFE